MEKPEHPLLSPRNFWPASLYLLLLGVLSAVLVELNQNYHWVRLEWLAVALLLVVLIGGYRLFERLRRAIAKGTEMVSLVEKEDVGGAVALIVFVSQGPGKTSGLQAAIYHAGKGTLRHLWLITTRAAESDAQWVIEQIRSQRPDLQIHEIQFLDDKDSIQEAKSMVEHLRQRAMAEFRVAEPDIICDFTGLTKNASAGMILACAPKPARLQYMVPNRVDDGGRADPSAGSRPREVFIQYMIIEEH
jgi:hypothetical protein